MIDLVYLENIDLKKAFYTTVLTTPFSLKPWKKYGIRGLVLQWVSTIHLFE